MTTTVFTNCRVCEGGRLVHRDLVVSNDTGRIADGMLFGSRSTVDLGGAIIGPGLIELQTNGMKSFHFTHFENKQSYAQNVEEIARYLPSTGCTSFYATVPTVSSDDFKKTLKLVTVAPELEDSESLIRTLIHNGTRVSLGHSAASYAQGMAALQAGASCLTHTLNAMAPLHHRDPGLVGLVTAAPSTTSSSPYFSIITDGNHLHPSVATMLFRADPSKCIVITDSIELAGLPDGTYPGHAQIPFNQTKQGSGSVVSVTEQDSNGGSSSFVTVTEQGGNGGPGSIVTVTESGSRGSVTASSGPSSSTQISPQGSSAPDTAPRGSGAPYPVPGGNGTSIAPLGSGTAASGFGPGVCVSSTLMRTFTSTQPGGPTITITIPASEAASPSTEVSPEGSGAPASASYEALGGNDTSISSSGTGVTGSDVGSISTADAEASTVISGNASTSTTVYTTTDQTGAQQIQDPICQRRT